MSVLLLFIGLYIYFCRSEWTLDTWLFKKLIYYKQLYFFLGGGGWLSWFFFWFFLVFCLFCFVVLFFFYVCFFMFVCFVFFFLCFFFGKGGCFVLFLFCFLVFAQTHAGWMFTKFDKLLLGNCVSRCKRYSIYHIQRKWYNFFQMMQ